MLLAGSIDPLPVLSPVQYRSCARTHSSIYHLPHKKIFRKAGDTLSVFLLSRNAARSIHSTNHLSITSQSVMYLTRVYKMEQLVLDVLPQLIKELFDFVLQ